MAIDFKKELNENQYLAATSDAKHLRIIAGAGTGKTRTLTYRLAYLIARGDVYASHIVAITFTNKVAREMRERVERILGDNFANVKYRPLITTFHGLCYRFLMKEFDKVEGLRKGFQVADDQDQKNIFKTVGEKFRYDTKSEEFKSMVSFVHKFKTEGKFVNDISQSDVWPNGNYRKVVDFYDEYQKELIKNNLVDFDDLLMYTYKVMRDNPSIRSYYHKIFRVFMIDEFQDTNNLQYELVKLFMDEGTELCVVGDPDQTIYTWRGANNNIIKRDLARDFRDLETVTLDLNYRSTQKILDKANELIKYNTDRVDKNLKAFSKEDGEDVELLQNVNGGDEARNIGKKINELHRKGVPYKDIAIIYRSNFLSRSFEHTFANMRIPYELYGGVKFYERDEVKSALAYIKIAFNVDDNYSFERVLKNPSRGIGDKSLEELYRNANERELPLLVYMLSIESIDELPLTKSRRDAVNTLLTAYLKFRNVVTNTNDPKEVVDAIKLYFDETGFEDYVRGRDSKEGDSIKGTSREQNVQELIGSIETYLKEGNGTGEDTEEERDLLSFLINVALESAQDTIEDDDKVLVMTAHISKGLEFPYVFVTGLVEDVFPAIRSVMENGKEEERRLLYVAMTRAKKQLWISTFGGYRFGSTENLPSSFLKELGFETERSRMNGMSSLDYQRQRNIGYRGNSGYASNEPRYTSGRPWSESNSELFNSGYNSDEPYVGYSKPKELPKHMTVSKMNVSSTTETYKVGDKIAHSSYGIGVVTSVDGKKLKVKFSDEYGMKTLIAGFKAFKKI